MNVRVDSDQYIKTAHEDGALVDTQPMSRQIVESWLEGSSFFDSLVSVPETQTQDAQGVITVTQQTPWDTQRVVTFTPAK